MRQGRTKQRDNLCKNYKKNNLYELFYRFGICGNMSFIFIKPGKKIKFKKNYRIDDFNE